VHTPWGASAAAAQSLCQAGGSASLSQSAGTSTTCFRATSSSSSSSGRRSRSLDLGGQHGCEWGSGRCVAGVVLRRQPLSLLAPCAASLPMPNVIHLPAAPRWAWASSHVALETRVPQTDGGTEVGPPQLVAAGQVARRAISCTRSREEAVGSSTSWLRQVSPHRRLSFLASANLLPEQGPTPHTVTVTVVAKTGCTQKPSMSGVPCSLELSSHHSATVERTLDHADEGQPITTSIAADLVDDVCKQQEGAWVAEKSGKGLEVAFGEASEEEDAEEASERSSETSASSTDSEDTEDEEEEDEEDHESSTVSCSDSEEDSGSEACGSNDEALSSSCSSAGADEGAEDESGSEGEEESGAEAGAPEAPGHGTEAAGPPPPDAGLEPWSLLAQRLWAAMAA